MKENNKNGLLSKAECTALRGIAIMAIMLHNYCHWLSGSVKENEYTFHIGNSEGIWNAICHADGLLPMQLLSYFGHYGVPVFLFLSGFGLVLKYERENEPRHKAWPFLKFHYQKLFRMMIPGFVAFVFIDAITPGAWHFRAENVIALLLMYVNVLPHPNNIIWPGPYWFFGLMMQLYIIYRLLIYRRHWGWTVGLIVICWIAQAVCDPIGDTLNRLRYNCIGGMMPFGVGVLAGRYLSHASCHSLPRPCWAVACVILSALLTLMCFNYQTWYWVPLLIIAASICMVKSLPSFLMDIATWLGRISAAMFVIHPVLRKVFIPFSRHGNVYDGILLYVITSIAMAWMFTWIINRIPSPKLNG